MQRKNCLVSIPVLKDRSNLELVEGAKHLVGRSRIITAHLIAHLTEIYARKLHVAEGFSYLGNYCTNVLGMSEAEAKRRSHAAMLAEKYPVILDMLLDGSIHLTTLRIVGKCLTPKNHRRILNASCGKSNVELEHLAAVLNPKPDLPTVLRKLTEPRSETHQLDETMFMGGKVVAEDQVFKEQANTVVIKAKKGDGSPASYVTVESPVHPESGAHGLEVRLDGVLLQVVASSPKPHRLVPLSAERYSLQLTISKEAHDALRELQDLLRHQVPNGDLVKIIQDSIIERRDRVKRGKFGHGKRPRKSGEQENWVEKKPAVLVGETENRIASSQPEGTPRAPERFDSNCPSAPSAPGRLVNSRHIPIAVKREVWQRDRGRCAFVSRSGRRCSETGRLEFHHVCAYALGGPATVENISLRCRTHNAYEGVALFGEKKAATPRNVAGANRPGAIAGP